jgi:hypothetical protein
MPSELVRRLCRLPAEFKATRTKSMIALLVESGYLESDGLISADEIKAELSRSSGLVDAWFNYSQDQRSSSGWYVTEHGPGNYEVGLVPAGPREAFTDRLDACAAYVARKIAELRKHAV